LKPLQWLGIQKYLLQGGSMTKNQLLVAMLVLIIFCAIASYNNSDANPVLGFL
jgi:hypothetical protein